MSGIGTISYSGNTAVYTPPAAGTGSATLSATSAADSTKSASAAVQVTAAPAGGGGGSVTVSVAPSNPTVLALGQQQFSATVSGTTNTGVVWSVNGVPGGSATIGTISAQGVYTAPVCPSAASVTIAAQSSYDSSASASTTAALSRSNPAGYHYVANGGSDSNSGSGCSAWATLQHAADVVNAGDTVIVADGTYSNPSASGTGSTLVNATRGGNSSAWVTFRSQNKWGAVLDGLSNTTAEGWEFVASYIRVQDFEIRGFSDDALSNYRGGQFIDIIGNHIHHMGRYCTDTGIGRDGIFVSKSNVTVEQNLIHDIGRFSPGENGCNPSTPYYQGNDHGIYVAGASNVMIRNNIFYNVTHGFNVQVYPDAVDNLSILNNTFVHGTPYYTGQIIITNATTNSRIENNIFYQPTTAAVYVHPNGSTTPSFSLAIKNNISTNATLQFSLTGAIDASLSGVSYSANQESTNPLFVNVTGNDFHLSGGSPAVGRGLALSDVTVDYNNWPRANPPSVGGYEAGSQP